MPPTKPLALKKASGKYVYPFFDQRWNLFAPAPETSYRFAIRVQNENGDWSDWFYPTDKYLEKHRIFNAGYWGGHVLAEYSFVYWLHYDLHQQFGDAWLYEVETFAGASWFEQCKHFNQYKNYCRFYAKAYDQAGSKVQGRVELTHVKTKYSDGVELPEISLNED